MRRFAALLIPVVLAGCARADALAASDAWVRLAAVPGRPAAGYLVLTGGPVDATLVRVTSPAAGRIELHESMRMDAGGMAHMTMRPLPSISVGAGERVAFAPGGRHLMLFDVAPGVKPGTPVPLTLGFADGRTLQARARTVAAGDAAPGS